MRDQVNAWAYEMYHTATGRQFLKHEIIREALEEDLRDPEIIEWWHAEYFEDHMPWVREALTELGIAEHEVLTWIYFNLK